MKNKVSTFIRMLDGFTEKLGKVAAFFSILMVLVTCYIVITRYIFNTGAIAVQESVIYFNGILVLLSAGYTLKHTGHVRVDIFYNGSSDRYKAWVNFLGGIFLLLPVSVFIIWASWDYVMSSWSVMEQSGEAGGLPFVYLLKSLILGLGFTLIIQGLAEILRNAEVLFFSSPDAEILSKEEEAGAL